MAPSNFIKELNLDWDLIERDRKMSLGLADAHWRKALEVRNDRSEWSVHMMASATEYRRAGAHSILLSDPTASSRMFEQSGIVYAKMGRPYGLMMFW